MVLLSIIIGLGVTDLLSNISRQIKLRATVTFSWLQSSLVLFVFVALLQQWWESWGLQTVDHWNFGTMLLMLAGPVGLYVASHLLFPQRIEDSDLEGYYFDNAKAFWLLGASVVIVSTLFRPIGFGMALIDPDNAASVFLLLACLTLAFVRNRLFHKIVFPIVFLAMLLDLFVFNPNI
ncbi:hypothetical protein [Parasphingopyxis lamellibrachiae]|nr:hypothetical protein [Parasphingopyxis lamellibrachiae]